MDTKPLHQSYAIVKPFGINDDGEYAEFSVDVEPNNEFYGRILQMGQDWRLFHRNLYVMKWHNECVLYLTYTLRMNSGMVPN